MPKLKPARKERSTGQPIGPCCVPYPYVVIENQMVVRAYRVHRGPDCAGAREDATAEWVSDALPR